MNSFWEKIILGNTVKDWTIAIGIIVVSLAVFRILRTVVLIRLQKFAAKTASTIDDFAVEVLKKSVMPFLYILSFYIGLSYLSFPATANRIIHAAILAIAVYFIISIIISIFTYFFQRFADSSQTDPNQGKQAKGILLILKIILWLIGVVFLVDNLGYDITTIITGLGIGGIAIALAAQTILGDLFSYLVIFFDKPFELGDFIVIGDKAGSVEYIGIKTTRIRTPGGEQLVVSNTDLTNSRVQNFKRMERRRVVITVGVTYETPVEKLKSIQGIVKELLDEQEGVTFDRAHFAAMGDFSLNFEIVFYILTSDYVDYMNNQHIFLMNLFERFQKEQIDFAYPTQTLYVQKTGEENNKEA